MSHKPNVYSLPGTPLRDRTVGELVAERPGRSRVFQSFGIDFCCQGSRTVREACALKSIPEQTVAAQLETEAADRTPPAFNPADLPLPELADHIVSTHHAYLRHELPRLHAMADRVARVHAGHTPSLLDVFVVFQAMEEELCEHLEKEERILFPAVVAMSRGTPAGLPLDGPIACMLLEHDDAGDALRRLRELTNGFVPPADACNTYRALFAGLQDLEEDLHRHIHLENSVLFPAAQALQNSGH